MMQGWLAGIIVVACAGYVLWTLLLPATVRRRVLQALGREPQAPQACGCDGCDRHPVKAQPPKDQVVRWMPRRRG